jgi:hypothetical protein
LKRIECQADAIGVYDRTYILDESDLDVDFRERFKDKLIPGTRGFGYWVWKPQIMLQVFRDMNEGDLLHYCDTGCWINPKGKQRLLQYFELANEHGALAFQSKNTFNDPLLDHFSLPERNWTKGDVFDYFSARENPEITDSEQIGCGIILLKKCPKSEELLRRWIGAYEDDFSLVDDSPSRSPNLEGFIENRHDQSIFGILCKLSGVKTLSAFEYYYPSRRRQPKPDWNKLEHYPIWAKRDKDLGIIGFIKYKFKKLFATHWR